MSLPEAEAVSLEKVERLPPPKPGGDQEDALLHATWTPDNGACVGARHGVPASRVGVISA